MSEFIITVQSENQPSQFQSTEHYQTRDQVHSSTSDKTLSTVHVLKVLLKPIGHDVLPLFLSYTSDSLSVPLRRGQPSIESPG